MEIYFEVLFEIPEAGRVREMLGRGSGKISEDDTRVDRVRKRTAVVKRVI